MKKVFNKVEEVLSNYPEDWTKNYYKNKETVKVNIIDHYVCDIEGLYGQYKDIDNYIEIKGLGALPHELIHMAFSNPEKYNTKIFENRANPLYNNGISMCTKKGDDIKLINKGINEGMVEYIARKCKGMKGQYINYYFTDLLISIFGEDLLKYGFNVDPIGFYADQRFDYINLFASKLDDFNNQYDMLIVFNQVMNMKENIKEELEYVKNNVFPMYNITLIETFDAIINEYNKYSDRLIDREQLNIKLQFFMDNYDLFKTFDNEKYNVKKYLKGKIN